MSVAVAAPSSSSVDRLRASDAPLWLQAAGVLGFAGLTALFAQADLRIYLWEVPLTLQTVAVYSAGLFLGSRNGALAMGLYLLAGLALPLFADGGTGLAHLLGASGGYLVAFPFVAALGGALTRERRTVGRTLLALVAGSLLLFTFGVAWLHTVADHATWTESLVGGWLRFVPWDLTKIALVASLYAAARRASA